MTLESLDSTRLSVVIVKITSMCVLLYLFFFVLFLNFYSFISHVFPILNPPPSTHLPPHNIPLGRPSAPAPSNQRRALNLDWHLVSYIVLLY